MPTIIVLDLSLSMHRPASKTVAPSTPIDVEDVESQTLLDLAKVGVRSFLNHLDKNSKLEFVSLIGFSSQCDLICPFTRDFQEILDKLESVECLDNTNVAAAFKGIASYVQEQWTNSVPINIILITDEGLPLPQERREWLSTEEPKPDVSPFGFPGSLTVMCLANAEDVDSKAAQNFHEKVIKLAGIEGEVVFPELSKAGAEVNAAAVEKMFSNFFTSRYRQFIATLKFGAELTSQVTISPSPTSIMIHQNFEEVEIEIEQTIDIQGFLNISDVSSPPVISRHLVLPHVTRDDAPTDDESRIASLCVFLHGALKVENMCAVVKVASDKTSPTNWFGIMFSCSDSKKKSNLMLALFEPGNNPVPWLGDLRRLGPLDDLNATSNSPFPVKASAQKPSYSSSPVVWIREASLQSDIQKILRNARKLPDKTPHFYKELNRLRRAAVALGFTELLEEMAAIFERECSNLPSSAHPDCTTQLTHAAQELRSKQAFKYDYQISPVGSKLSSGSKRE